MEKRRLNVSFMLVVRTILSINQITMGLLFLQLMNQIECVEMDQAKDGQKFMMTVLRYIEEHYRDGELSDLTKEMHYALYMSYFH